MSIKLHKLFYFYEIVVECLYEEVPTYCQYNFIGQEHFGINLGKHANM